MSESTRGRTSPDGPIRLADGDQVRPLAATAPLRIVFPPAMVAGAEQFNAQVGPAMIIAGRLLAAELARSMRQQS